MQNNYIAYLHLETQLTALDVGGWFPEQMRVSVAAVSCGHELFLFMEDDLPRMMQFLNSASCVVGYNLHGFDCKVLSGYLGLSLEKVRFFDLLPDIEKASGKRIHLAPLVLATLGYTLNKDGPALARSWKAGDVSRVVEGCCNRVLAIRAVHEYGAEKKHVLHHDTSSQQGTDCIPVDWCHDPQEETHDSRP